MKEKIKAAVLGGDDRQTYLAELLAARGWQVRVYGTYADVTGVERCRDAVTAVRGADAVIFPMPAVKGGIYLNEKSDAETAFRDILDAVDEDGVVFAGRTDTAFAAACRERGLRFIDYYESEPLTVKNAWLTAEGALFIYMSEKKVSVMGSKILVLGSGRVAKCVSGAFAALGARVTVMARNSGELAWAQLLGRDTRDISDASARNREFASGYDAIVNTIPVAFITGCSLNVIPDETLIIDLASAPYGVDVTEAARCGKNAHRATSLPGKYAPESAARIISEVIAAHYDTIGGQT